MKELEIGGGAATQPLLVKSIENKTSQYTRLSPRIKLASQAARKSASSYAHSTGSATTTHRDEPDCACKACNQAVGKENQTQPPVDNLEEKQESSHQQVANSFRASRK
jgi:hypothetical protein